MIDHPAIQTGYCTNVHAGTDLQAIESNLAEYATVIRDTIQSTNGENQLGVGLWIPDQASRELFGDRLDRFRDFLATNQLLPFTINGFPFDNFHGDAVKQRVYLPTWADPDRLQYTLRLAEVLAQLLPDHQTVGSISTLPIGWPDNPMADTATSNQSTPQEQLDGAGKHLRSLASSLHQLEERTGKRIVVAIEPEPGCVLDTADDVIAFFDQQLEKPLHRKYITACHDICHSAVMNEPQRDVIRRYAESGIGIGKVQVSSAIVADWKSISPDQHTDALRQLSQFAEDRYLHQTGQISKAGDFQLATDLPELIQSTRPEDLRTADRWVIHFHVPIFLERFELLSTSRDDVIECLKALGDDSLGTDFTGHLEVETYAWSVLPEHMRERGLAQDIASELIWLDGLLK